MTPEQLQTQIDELEKEVKEQYINLSELDSSIKESEDEIEYHEQLIDSWQDERSPLLLEIKQNELQISILKGETTQAQLIALTDKNTVSLFNNVK